jgi:hypothetical protein
MPESETGKPKHAMRAPHRRRQGALQLSNQLSSAFALLQPTRVKIAPHFNRNSVRLVGTSES